MKHLYVDQVHYYVAIGIAQTSGDFKNARLLMVAIDGQNYDHYSILRKRKNRSKFRVTRKMANLAKKVMRNRDTVNRALDKLMRKC